jgi:membrane-associated protein
MQQITDAVLAAAESPWIYLVVFVLTVLDAFIVVLPSETVVVALGALALSGSGPSLWTLVAVAAVAAIIGDSLTFGLGNRVGLDRFRWMSRPRVRKAFAWAHASLDRRAAVVLLTARFVPFGRIAVNLTAGATGFDYRRFLGLTAVAGCCWALYNAVVGALFGAWFGGNPVLAVALSIVVAVGLGVLVDLVSARLARPRARETTS